MSLDSKLKALLNTLKLPFEFFQSIQKVDTVDIKDISDLDKLKADITYKGSTIEAYVLEHKTYLLHDNFSTNTPFFIPPATNTLLIETTTITSNITARQLFYDSSTSSNPTGTPLFIGRNVGFFETKEITFIGSFVNDTCFDLEGTGVGQTSIMSVTRGGVVSWASLGIIASFGIVPIDDSIFQIYAKGLQINSPNTTSSNRISLFIDQIPALGFTETTFSYTGTNGIIAGNDSLPIGLATGESLFYLDKSLEGSRVELKENSLNSSAGASLFRADISKTITAMANADKPITSFADSTINAGVDTTCFVINHQYLIGQKILITDEVAYDGVQTIIRTTADSFDINVVFSTSGAGTSKETKFTTSTTHGFLKNMTIVESGTTNYNAESQIVSLVSDTEYTKPIVFNTDEGSGTADSISLIERSIYVDAKNNGDAKDSKSIGSMDVNDNTTATTISTINTYVDFNLNSLATDNTNIEQWTLTNTNTGELRYDGLKTFIGSLQASVSAQSSGSAQEFVFRYVRNGSAMSNAIELATELRADTNSLTIVAPIVADTGDLFRPQVKNIDGTSNIVIRFMSTEIL